MAMRFPKRARDHTESYAEAVAENPPSEPKLAIVVAGAGARGGYEAGALSVLIPHLRKIGKAPSMYIGTSAGAINATLFAAYAHLPPDEQADRVLDVWRTFTVSEVFRSPVVTSPGVALRFLGQTLHVPGVRLVSLVDTAPLMHKAETVIDWNQLGHNIEAGTTLAVVATAGDNSRTAVFVHQAQTAPPLPLSDDDRAIDYVSTVIGPPHVVASSAIPIVFPPVEIGELGWYLDGGVRLNAPLKPAIALGADEIVAVATHPLSEPKPEWKSDAPPPDVDDMVVQLIDIVLVDRMVEDARTLTKVNKLVDGSAVTLARSGRPYEQKKMLFVSPERRAALGELAMKVYDENSHPPGSGIVARIRREELRALGRVLAGDGPRRGDVFSYLYFDPAFIEQSIEHGRRDAQRHLDMAMPNTLVPWTTQ
jgi:NTE family protein